MLMRDAVAEIQASSLSDDAKREMRRYLARNKVILEACVPGDVVKTLQYDMQTARDAGHSVGPASADHSVQSMNQGFRGLSQGFHELIVGLKGHALPVKEFGGSPGNSGQVHTYRLRGRGVKRGRSLQSGGGNTSAEAGPETSEGNENAPIEAMDAREAAYHADLVHILRQPAMYHALGLSGPPNCIEHSTLEERMQTFKLVAGA